MLNYSFEPGNDTQAAVPRCRQTFHFLLVSSKQKDPLNGFPSDDGFQNWDGIKRSMPWNCLWICVSSNKDQHYETFVFSGRESCPLTMEIFGTRKSNRALSSAWNTLYQYKTPYLEETGNGSEGLHPQSLIWHLFGSDPRQNQRKIECQTLPLPNHTLQKTRSSAALGFFGPLRLLDQMPAKHRLVWPVSYP